MANLGIGTVQFGLDYGISNKQGKTEFKEVKKILNYAKLKNIQILDTASVYGSSEEVLGEMSLKNNFKIVTKISLLKEQNRSIKKKLYTLKKAFKKSLINLKIDSIYGVLFHNADDIINTDGEYLFDELLKYKELGLIKKIGISAYTENQIVKVLNKYKIDLIQIPVNIFDQRLINSGILKELKKKNIEIHARSPFLQGLIFINPKNLSSHFDSVKPLLQKFHKTLKEKNLSPIEVAIAYLNQIKEIDTIICGINNKNQLEELCKISVKNININEFKDFYINNEQIINPSNWVV